MDWARSRWHRAAELSPGVLLAGAAFFGSLQAATSLYWALGGRLLLETVGQWAIALAEAPAPVSLALFGICLVKSIAAGVPLAAHRLGHLQQSGLLADSVFMLGAVIALYGLLQAAGAGMGVLLALVYGERPSAALLGHLCLWGPLFMCWGACLISAMNRQRRILEPQSGRQSSR